MSLYLTKTRLEMLQDVADGFVTISVDGGDRGVAFLQWTSSRKPRKVTSRVEELRAAGLVRIGPEDDKRRCVYQLTEAGRVALGGGDA